MAVVKKYVLVVPKNVSAVDGVYTCTWPTPISGFEMWNVCSDRTSSALSFYDALKDRRQIWVLKGEEAIINAWITDNSDMVTEKAFAEADAIGKELSPLRNYTVNKVTTEDGVVIEEVGVVKSVPAFDLQAELTTLGI